jgi:thiamine-monophosphate kinase
VKPEDRFVERLKELLPLSPSVLIAPGDDAAVVQHAGGPLAATTDVLVEGIDFLPGEDPERLGRRAAAVNLSDLAAIGARPEFLMLAIAFPTELGEDYPLAVVRGTVARAGEFGATLVGGDLSAAAQTMIAVALWGRPAGNPITRSGAADGDVVFVTGFLGQAAAGLRLARDRANAAARGIPGLSGSEERALLDAYHDPTPQVAFGVALAREGIAHAAIDVSDGLGVDAGRLARASGVRIVLEKTALPLSEPLLRFGEARGIEPAELALAGGDDYELLFTASPEDAERVEGVARRLAVRATRIGRVEAGEGASLRDGSAERDIVSFGHDHFQGKRA